jgi:hypothetical protein
MAIDKTMLNAMVGALKTANPRYALNSNDLGRKFTFNAVDMAEAVTKAKNWTHYHGFNFNSEYNVTEIADTDTFDDLHNEWVK